MESGFKNPPFRTPAPNRSPQKQIGAGQAFAHPTRDVKIAS